MYTERFHRVENGVTVEGPKRLPRTWGNFDGMHHRSYEELRELGWLPEVVVGFEPFDRATQVRSGPVDTVEADRATSTYTVRDKTSEELAAYRNPLIRAEAERRIAEGCMVGAVRFRCDDQSVLRIQGLATLAQRLEDAGQPVNIAFRTAAGDDVAIASAAAAWALFDAASDHVAGVLAASAALQADPPADFTADTRWPQE